MEKTENQVWTIQLGRWRLAKELGIELVDITVKSGVYRDGTSVFGPREDYLWLYKKGQMSDEEYTRLYKARMAISQRKYPEEWERLALLPKAAYACYCAAGKFCHRHDFVTVLEEYLLSRNHTVVKQGELTNAGT